MTKPESEIRQIAFIDLDPDNREYCGTYAAAEVIGAATEMGKRLSNNPVKCRVLPSGRHRGEEGRYAAYDVTYLGIDTEQVSHDREMIADIRAGEFLGIVEFVFSDDQDAA